MKLSKCEKEGDSMMERDGEKKKSGRDAKMKKEKWRGERD